jgi:hypothetical protein
VTTKPCPRLHHHIAATRPTTPTLASPTPFRQGGSCILSVADESRSLACIRRGMYRFPSFVLGFVSDCHQLGRASADAQYKYVSGATVKAYRDYNELKAAWHRRCELGEHNHPAAPLHAHAHAHDQTPSRVARSRLPAPIRSPAPVRSPMPIRSPSPRRRLRTYIIHSCSPSRTPSPVPGSRSPSPASASPTDDDPPAYSAIFEAQLAPSINPPLAGEHMGRSHEGPRTARSRRQE